MINQATQKHVWTLMDVQNYATMLTEKTLMSTQRSLCTQAVCETDYQQTAFETNNQCSYLHGRKP